MFVKSMTIEERFQQYVMPEPNSGCWLWMGHVGTEGYGQFGVNRRALKAHRVSYELFCAPIPAGLQLDHKCRVRCCVNPDHLEPVTSRENTRRGITGLVNGKRQREKTHCPEGHPYAGSNLIVREDGTRRCRTCKCAADRERRALKARSSEHSAAHTTNPQKEG